MEDLSHIETTDEKPRGPNLGTVRLRRHGTHEIILIPAPSNDPNDPLNWSKPYRWYIAVLCCLAMFLAQFLAAGPSVAMVHIVIDLFGTPPKSPQFFDSISKASYLFTGVAFVQGMVNLFSMPFIVKFGRRPVYVVSFLVYGAASLWCGRADSFASELCARLLLGLAGGSAETLAPLTIADIFFLHERGLVMAFYSVAVSAGTGTGILISGLITIHQSWRVIYYIITALTWSLALAIVFTMPETAYRRNRAPAPELERQQSESEAIKGYAATVETAQTQELVPAKKSYVEKLKLFNGVLTKEHFMKLLWRPVPLMLLPAVLWGTLTLSVMVSAAIAVSSNFATAFATLYGWSSWQSGLAWISNIIGALIGVAGGGWLSDKSADFLTKRNDGIREAEMRLPIVTLSLIASPLASVLYGVGMDQKLHWIVPVLSLGVLGFTITLGVNSVIVYVVDAYRPIAGEAIVAMLAFKAAIGFLLSFYINPWIEDSGYITAFGTLAGIQAAILLMWIPLYIWGKRIRHATLKWNVMKGVRWDEDREVGE